MKFQLFWGCDLNVKKSSGIEKTGQLFPSASTSMHAIKKINDHNYKAPVTRKTAFT